MEFTNFSVKLRKLRTKKKVSMEDLAKKTGISEKYLLQIENNEVIAPVSVVLEVAQALAVSKDELLMIREEKKKLRKAQKQRSEAFKRRIDNYSYEGLTTGSRSKHLTAFKVTVNPLQEHNLVECHHLGEEFIYVLSGELELKVSRNKYILKPGDSQHFDSSKSHRLRSISSEPAVILITIYSPLS